MPVMFQKYSRKVISSPKANPKLFHIESLQIGSASCSYAPVVVVEVVVVDVEVVVVPYDPAKLCL